jgi:hypothetical protein
MTRAPDVFFIWYGCWDSACGNAGATTTRTILENFTPNVGGTPYSKSTPCTRICSANAEWRTPVCRRCCRYLIQQNWINNRKGHCAMDQALWSADGL